MASAGAAEQEVFTMMGRHSRTAGIAAAVLVTMLAAAGCSSDSSSTTVEPTGGSVSESPTAGSTAASADLTAWVSQVCAASEDTLQSDSFDVDASQLAQDPSGYIDSIVSEFQGVSDRLNAFADQLEQIGPPDVPNGEAISQQYTEASRELAAAYEEALAAAAAESNPVQAIGAFGAAFGSERMQRATAKFGDLSQLLSEDEIRTAAASVPECSSLNLG
jgi:hypothetical protein